MGRARGASAAPLGSLPGLCGCILSKDYEKTNYLTLEVGSFLVFVTSNFWQCLAFCFGYSSFLIWHCRFSMSGSFACLAWLFGAFRMVRAPTTCGRFALVYDMCMCFARLAAHISEGCALRALAPMYF